MGANYLTVTSTVTDADGQEVSLTYRLNVHRRQADEIYYNELYRGQYHYSVKDGLGQMIPTGWFIIRESIISSISFTTIQSGDLCTGAMRPARI